MTTIKANGHEIEISHPGKVLFPGEKLTKMDVVEFYQKISEYMIPYVKDRPMMLHRYPNGIEDKDFYQKEEPDYFPGWIDTIKVDVKKEGAGKQEFVNCNSEASLIYCANQASITPHIWLSRKDKLHHPDKMIFDLDPPEGEFEVVQQCARDFRKVIDELEMTAFVMTTGSKGIHIVLPLDRKSEFDEVREFAKNLAHLLAGREPEKYTTETLKKKRKGRLFLDYLRNSYGQTSVATYGLRARKGAPVATPLDWDEIGDKDLHAQSYHFKNIFRRLGRKENPWKDFFKKQNSLEKAREKLDEMKDE